MRDNLMKILGVCLLIASGIIYTAERITATISAAIVAAGQASNGSSYHFSPQYSGILGNFFVWFFLFIGFILLTLGFPKKSA